MLNQESARLATEFIGLINVQILDRSPCVEIDNFVRVSEIESQCGEQNVVHLITRCYLRREQLTRSFITC